MAKPIWQQKIVDQLTEAPLCFVKKQHEGTWRDTATVKARRLSRPIGEGGEEDHAAVRHQLHRLQQVRQVWKGSVLTMRQCDRYHRRDQNDGKRGRRCTESRGRRDARGPRPAPIFPSLVLLDPWRRGGVTDTIRIFTDEVLDSEELLPIEAFNYDFPDYDLEDVVEWDMFYDIEPPIEDNDTEYSPDPWWD